MSESAAVIKLFFDWAELFVAAGIRTVEELAKQDRQNLRVKIYETNRRDEHKISRYEPTDLELGYIIALARDAIAGEVAPESPKQGNDGIIQADLPPLDP